MPKNGWLGQFEDLREGGGLGKKNGVVFEEGGGGGDTIMHMSSLLISNKNKYYLAIDWLLIITSDVVRR